MRKLLSIFMTTLMISLVITTSTQAVTEFPRMTTDEILKKVGELKGDDKIRAAMTIALRQHTQAIPQLLGMLSDSDEKIRDGVAKALSNYSQDDLITHLVTSLSENDKYKQAGICMLIGYLGNPELGVHIQHFVNSDETFLSIAALKALGKLEDKTVVEPLLNLVEKVDSEEQAEIIQILEELGDERAVEPLINLLKKANSSKDSFLQYRLILAMAAFPNQNAAEALINTSDEVNDSLRYWIAWGLGKIGQPVGVPKLLEFLKSDSEDVRKASLEALTQLKDNRSVDELYEFFKKSHAEEKFLAAKALSQFNYKEKPEFFDELTGYFLYEFDEEKSTAKKIDLLQILAQFKDKKSAEYLEKRVNTVTNVILKKEMERTIEALLR